MRILVIGGQGMLGHQIFLTLRKKHDVRVTLRKELKAYEKYNLFTTANSYAGVDVCDMDALIRVLVGFKPHAVINAVGVVKQLKTAKEAVPCLEVNAVFPHRLALLCKTVNARLIHVSTDCVFSGKKGKYTEDDFSDAEDLYGRSKYLGEVEDEHCVTLRSSIIGLELSRKTGLVEWFLAQKGTIKGFEKAIYSGITTQEMSRVIDFILTECTDLSGVWHVSSDTEISKYELLKTLSALLGRDDITILPDNDFACDRSLRGERFKQVTGYKVPDWKTLLKELSEQVKQREMELCS